MSEHVITYEQVEKKVTQKKVILTLAHCPFCGGEAVFRVGGNYNSKLGRRMGVGVRCTECGASTRTREESNGSPHARAAEIWNRRVSA